MRNKSLIHAIIYNVELWFTDIIQYDKKFLRVQSSYENKIRMDIQT